MAGLSDIEEAKRMASIEAINRNRATIATKLAIAANDATHEALRASEKFSPFNSAHEGFAILAEELDETAEAAGLSPVILATGHLWEHVKTNQNKRDIAAMRKEAIQVAAMALRFVVDICDGGRGRV